MNTTLQLSSSWDLMLDGHGNIAMIGDSAAIAQDVGSAVYTFLGEVWFNTSVGLPYFAQILGQPLNAPLFSSLYNQIALTVPNVVKAQTTFTALTPTRRLSGTIKVIDTAGQAIDAQF